MTKDTTLIIVLVAALSLGVGAFLWFGGRAEESTIVETGGVAPAPERPGDARRDLTQNAVAEPRPAPAANDSADRPGEPPAGTARDPYGNGLAKIWGNVVTAEGVAIADARLTLSVDMSDRLDWIVAGEVVAQAVSGADGGFLIDAIPTYDTYGLRIEHAAYASVQADRQKLEPFEVAYREIIMGTGHTVTGLAVDESDQPVAGATVFIQDIRVAIVDSLKAVERRAVCDAEGRFILPAISSGQKNLVAMKEGYSSAAMRNVVVDVRFATTEQRLVLKPGFSISGRVWDEDRQPLEGATVSAVAVSVGGPEINEGLYLPVRSAADGTYSLTGLAAGQYLVRGSMVSGGHEALRNSGAGASDVDLVIGRVPVVRGRVLDEETGDPVTAFSIVSSPTDRLMGFSKQRAKRFFDADGRFEFPMKLLPPGTRKAWVFAVAPGRAAMSAEVQLIPDLHAAAIGLQKPAESDPTAAPRARDVDGVVIRLSRGASVHGFVKDVAGAGIVGAKVGLVAEFATEAQSGDLAILKLFQRSASSTSEMAMAMSSTDGSFTIDGVAAGRFSVRVEHPRYTSHHSEATFDIGVSGSFAVGTTVLSRGGRVHGVVKDQDHRPEEGARVVLSPQEAGGESYSMRTGITGEYSFPHVRPGIYSIAVAERKGLNPFAVLLASGALGPQQNMTLIIGEGETVERDL